MTLNEFTISTKTLEDFYGKELNMTQKKIWFDKLKNYAQEKYERAIISQCEISKYMPTLSQILEVVPKSNGENRKIIPCNICKGTGYILYWKEENKQKYQYVCLCSCANAEDKRYNGLQINDKEHRQPYYVKTADEVFGDRLTAKINVSNEVQRDTKNLISDLSKQMSF